MILGSNLTKCKILLPFTGDPIRMMAARGRHVPLQDIGVSGSFHTPTELAGAGVLLINYLRSGMLRGEGWYSLNQRW